MKLKHKNTSRWLTVRAANARVDDPPPPPDPAQEALERAKYEAEAAKAEAAKIKKALEEVQRQLPTAEERAKWAELEQQSLTADEKRRREEGKFDEWRAQINDKHTKELDAERQIAANARALAEERERELNDTFITQSFQGATDWFGPTGKTVMLPEVARSYFARNVEVEVVPAPNGGPTRRRVIVRDSNGTILVDPRSGQPMPFDKAIGELIDAHPQKQFLLKGSGKVGSGSAGGGGDETDINLGRLKQADFSRPEVRDKVRQALSAPGGLQIGPGFDRLRQGKK